MTLDWLRLLREIVNPKSEWLIDLNALSPLIHRTREISNLDMARKSIEIVVRLSFPGVFETSADIGNAKNTAVLALLRQSLSVVELWPFLRPRFKSNLESCRNK
jgi:hypothetical protein